MNQPTSKSKARREFLKFLAASPYVAAMGGVAAYLEKTAFAQGPPSASDLITSPAEALEVLDFKEVAHRKVMDGHWAYMESGVDDDGTLRANMDGYKHVQLRPRRLRDATKVDMRVELFGTTYSSPIFLCPTSGHKAFQSRRRIGGGARGQGSRHAAVPLHRDLHRRGRCEQSAGPSRCGSSSMRPARGMRAKRF